MSRDARTASEAQRWFDAVRALNNTCLQPGALDQLHRELDEQERGPALSYRLARLLLDTLRPTKRPIDPTPIEERFDDLVDDLIRTGRFEAVRRLVDLLNGYAAKTHCPEEAQFAHEMRARIGLSRNVAIALRAAQHDDGEADKLLTSLGPYAVPGLLDVVDSVDEPSVRASAIEHLIACAPNPGKVLVFARRRELEARRLPLAREASDVA